MFAHRNAIAIAFVVAIALSGCAGGDGLNLATGSLNDTSAPATKTTKNAVSPECVALYQKIDTMRTEGTPARIKEVAAGKTETAVVKRKALARVSELDDAHQQLQSKCSRYTPAQLRAATPRPIVKAATTPAPAKVKSEKTSATSAPTKVKTAAKTPPKSISAMAESTASKKAATTSPSSVTQTAKATTTDKAKTPTPIVVNAKKTVTETPVAKRVVATAGKSATTTASTTPVAANPLFPPIGSTGIPSAGTGGVVVTTPPQ